MSAVTVSVERALPQVSDYNVGSSRPYPILPPKPDDGSSGEASDRDAAIAYDPLLDRMRLVQVVGPLVIGAAHEDEAAAGHTETGGDDADASEATDEKALALIYSLQSR